MHRQAAVKAPLEPMLPLPHTYLPPLNPASDQWPHLTTMPAAPAAAPQHQQWRHTRCRRHPHLNLNLDSLPSRPPRLSPPSRPRIPPTSRITHLEMPAEVMEEPGAKMSTQGPRLEKEDSWSVCVELATVMEAVLLAGDCVQASAQVGQPGRRQAHAAGRWQASSQQYARRVWRATVAGTSRALRQQCGGVRCLEHAFPPPILLPPTVRKVQASCSPL